MAHAILEPRAKAGRVFLVYGRNRDVRLQLVSILTAIGLEVLNWEQAAALTRKPAPFAQEVLEAAMRNVDAVVVLMSGDEEARLRPEFCAEDEQEIEGVLRPQARPNVIFEAGLAFGLFPKSTVLVQLGRLRQISDLNGMQYVPLDSSPESRQALLNRLRNAGCRIQGAVADTAPPGLPSPEDGLPAVDDSKGYGVKMGLFRRLGSLLPIPRMGGNLEVVTHAVIGEAVVLSIGGAVDSRAVRILHWLPGNAEPGKSQRRAHYSLTRRWS
jgi:predicted nucleotide-binding protein